MKCWYPKTLDNGIIVGCHRCPNCSIDRKRLWIGRMVLEAADHPFSAFVTLTYKPEKLPEDGSLNKKHLQDFLKRLRKKLFPRQIRFYAVGEYGDKSWRPHYHLIIFGLSPTENETVQSCWTLGFTLTGTAEPSSMSYVGSYVMKKMTNKKDTRLNGLHPEFCTMSLRPGLGAGFVSRLVSSLKSEAGMAARKLNNDKFETIRVEGRKYPIGTYLKKRIELAIGTDPAQKRENLWRSITERIIAEHQLGASETNRRKAQARKIAKAQSQAKATLTRRLL